MKVYISGPMTGYPELNFPAFFKMEDVLKRNGWEILNPARNPKQESWSDYMRIDIKMLMDADSILMLKGWENSNGAKIELDLASKIGIERIYLKMEG